MRVRQVFLAASLPVALLGALIAWCGCNAVFGLDPVTLVTDASDGTDQDVPNDLGDGGEASGDTGSVPPTRGPDGGIIVGMNTPPPAADGGFASADASCSPACAGGLTCERYDGPVCVDSNWAEWAVPNSPIDVTAGAGNAESYTDNGDGTITDNVTKLMWQQAASSSTFSQPAALVQCEQLDLAGYKDWRLPSEIELISLVDYGTSGPAIDIAKFPGQQGFAFWSSTLVAGSSTQAWTVTFYFGTVGIDYSVQAYYARCVR